MGMTATDWGWKRSNLRTNKGICPPWLQDNEYRRDLTPNNPGYHHTRTIWWQNMMSSSHSNISHSAPSSQDSDSPTCQCWLVWHNTSINLANVKALMTGEIFHWEETDHLECHDTNQDISGQMENIDGPQSTQQRQIGIFTVGLTFMNWNGWKMKGEDEAVYRDDYMTVFMVRDLWCCRWVSTSPPAVPDNIKNIPWNWERKPGQVQGLSFVIW